MTKVAFATLGCKVNQFDTAAVQDSLIGKVDHVDFAQWADVYVINTCTVTHRADTDARRLIRRAKRQNPAAKVIVTGCYAQTQPEVVAALAGVDAVVGNSHKDQLPEFILQAPVLPSDSPVVQVRPLGFKHAIPDLPELSAPVGTTRGFVKIQDGCDYSCSFCIITVARGANTSLSVEAVIRQILRLEAAGVQEIVLTGVQIGRYGRDLNPSRHFHDALADILAATSVPRLRLSSIDPREFTPELLDLVVREPRICPHLHIPIQSGDDAILYLMRRDHDRAYMRELFGELKLRLPELMLGSDVIAGFPGEGPSEFDMTYEFVESWLDHVHVFSYSDRPGTHAAALPEKVPVDAVAKRANALRELGDRKRKLFAQRLVGTSQEVLLENRTLDAERLGYTRHYVPVLVPEYTQLKTLLRCKIAMRGDALVGAPLVDFN